METNLTNLRFQIESEHGTRQFEWDQYPVDLVGVVVDELDDVWLSRGDVTALVVMSVAPAISTAIRWSSTVCEILPDGTSAVHPIPVTVRLVDTVTDEVIFVETEPMFREDDKVGLEIADRPKDLTGMLGRIDKHFPNARKYNDQFLSLPDADRHSLFAATAAATTAVRAQLTDIFPDDIFEMDGE